MTAADVCIRYAQAGDAARRFAVLGFTRACERRLLVPEDGA